MGHSITKKCQVWCRTPGFPKWGWLAGEQNGQKLLENYKIKISGAKQGGDGGKPGGGSPPVPPTKGNPGPYCSLQQCKKANSKNHQIFCKSIVELEKMKERNLFVISIACLNPHYYKRT